MKPLDPPDLLAEMLAFEAVMKTVYGYTPQRNPRCIYDWESAYANSRDVDRFAGWLMRDVLGEQPVGEAGN